MTKKFLCVALAAAVMASANLAFAVGEAGAPSLIIPPGARANGMGETYVALAQDGTAAWWNPGGLAFVKNHQLAFMHSQLVPDLAPDVYYEFLGFANELKGIGTFSLAGIYLTYGNSVATNTAGDKTGEFSSWEGAFIASFGMPITPNFGVGLSMKFIHVDLAPADLTLEKLAGTGSTVALDLGALLKDEDAGISLGVALTNTGPDISFIDNEQSDPLPFILRTGIAYTVLSDEVSDLVLAFDNEQSMVWIKDDDITRPRSEIYHFGAEYRYVDMMSVRLGYVRDRDGDFKDPTLGLGFIVGDKISFDYANVPQAQTLERVHRVSVYLTF